MAYLSLAAVGNSEPRSPSDLQIQHVSYLEELHLGLLDLNSMVPRIMLSYMTPRVYYWV